VSFTGTQEARTAAAARVKNAETLILESEIHTECPQRKPHPGGIDQLQQLDSVLREMAELQAAINCEKTACAERIGTAQYHLGKTIGTWQAYFVELKMMVEAFMQKHYEKHLQMIVDYPFGSVSFLDGEVDVSLNVKLAAERRGKP